MPAGQSVQVAAPAAENAPMEQSVALMELKGQCEPAGYGCTRRAVVRGRAGHASELADASLRRKLLRQWFVRDCSRALKGGSNRKPISIACSRLTCDNIESSLSYIGNFVSKGSVKSRRVPAAQRAHKKPWDAQRKRAQVPESKDGLSGECAGTRRGERAQQM